MNILSLLFSVDPLIDVLCARLEIMSILNRWVVCYFRSSKSLVDMSYLIERILHTSLKFVVSTIRTNK